MTTQKSKGFTLIELMIVVTIIAILAALAYTNYSRYVLRTRRAEGRELLMRVVSAQERYYTNFNQYASTLTGNPPTGLGFTTNASCASLGVASENCYYAMAAVTLTNSNQGYVITANPQGAQANDACGALSISNTGTKTPAAGTLPQNSNGNCW